MNQISNLAARDAEDVLHPMALLGKLKSEPPMMIQRGEGIRVFDDGGNSYIDGLSGLWCTSLGYSNDEIAEAAYEQLRQLPYAHLFLDKSHGMAALLAEKLKAMVPGGFSKVFFGLSGSDANDTQIKLARYYFAATGRPEKTKVLSRARGYHGSTFMTAATTGLAPFHTGFGLPTEGFLKTGCPHPYRHAHPGESDDAFIDRLVTELEDLILAQGPETIAIFFAEPVMAAGGVIVPPVGYFSKIQEVLRKYDILFAADEVVTGFGRTGNPFGMQTVGAKPDTVTLAKSLTGAFLPLSAVMVPEFMFEAMAAKTSEWGVFGHGFTYSGHPVSCAVGLKVLEIYEREDVFAKAAKIGERMQAHLRAFADHPLVGEARGVGMIGAAELVADKATGRAFAPTDGVGKYCLARARENGLICRAIGDSMALCPPLVTTEAEIDEIFAIYQKSLDQTLDWVTRERVGA